MPQSIVIYGAGLLGQQLMVLMQSLYKGEYEVVSFIDERIGDCDNYLKTGLNVYGNLDSAIASKCCSPEKVKLILAIGYSDLAARFNAFSQAKSIGYKFLSLVHPSAIVSPEAEIGEGVFIGAGTIIDVSCKLGDANFIDAGCLIAERVALNYGNYLAAKVVICGSTKVGSCNFFGATATICNDLIIGDGNFINSQILLARNLKDNSRVAEVRQIRVID